MKPLFLLVSAVLLFPLPTTPFAHSPGATHQTASVQAAPVTSAITIRLPHDEAELSVEGSVIDGSGSSRAFVTSPLEKDASYRYTFVATWHPNTYTTMTRRKIVSFRGGEPVSVDLTVDDPNDRVQVMYVPTPDTVVEAMVELAGVSATDVVYEPGCGDARVTIAAVKSGARKGVGIDIDAERVAESRARVKEAGLEDRIEIRLGDALDIERLSEATVVFLYMGDHFNMLIRPILWRELKVGARVVSHRFTMGDWKPDKTVSVATDSAEVHLWTITEELKRQRGAP